MKHHWQFCNVDTLYINVNTHQREDDVSMMKKCYDYKMQVQEPGWQHQGAKPVQKMRVPEKG